MGNHIAHSDYITPWNLRIKGQPFPFCFRFDLPECLTGRYENHANAVEMFMSNLVCQKIIGGADRFKTAWDPFQRFQQVLNPLD